MRTSRIIKKVRDKLISLWFGPMRLKRMPFSNEVNDGAIFVTIAN